MFFVIASQHFEALSSSERAKIITSICKRRNFSVDGAWFRIGFWKLRLRLGARFSPPLAQQEVPRVWALETDYSLVVRQLG